MTRGGAQEGADATKYSKLQQRRRDEALERQRHARHKHINLARLAAADTEPGGGGPAVAMDTAQPPAQAAADTGMQRRRGRQRGRRGGTSQAAADAQQEGAGGHQLAQTPKATSAGAETEQGAGTEAPQGEMLVDDAGWGEPDEVQEEPWVFWSKQLQLPEWMTDVPPDLATKWLVLARPEGPRCLIITGRRKTVIRNKGGSVLFTCHTALPDGGPKSVAGAKDFCVLEAVWHQPNKTLYLVDLLVWRGYAMYDCTAEFRSFWLQSKLAEEPGLLEALAKAPHPANGGVPPVTAAGEDVAMAAEGVEAHDSSQELEWVRVLPLPVLAADAVGLTAAYQGGQSQPAGQQFTQDGLYFLHKDSHYAAGSSTPLALSWKDAACSAWPLDTDPQGGALQYQVLTLEYRMDCTVATADEPPVVLGTMPLAWVQAMGPKLLKPGRLLRFSLKEGGLLWAPDGRPAGADLHYEGPASRRRGRADTFSKILFQQMVRTRPLTWEHLIAAAQQGAPAQAPSGPPQDGSSMMVELAA